LKQPLKNTGKIKKLPQKAITKLKAIVEQKENLKRKGLTVLLVGESSSGKAEAVDYLSTSFKKDVYRIDLSMVVSKYIGETEKNLAKVFSQAENQDIILVFDEADALCGKRTEIADAHDRFAQKNLKRFERLKRVIMLSTSKKEKINEKYLPKFFSVIHFDPNGNNNEDD
jgi:SpoVK/Ycf46/Vps4 family AAA+-type ATPase